MRAIPNRDLARTGHERARPGTRRSPKPTSRDAPPPGATGDWLIRCPPGLADLLRRELRWRHVVGPGRVGLDWRQRGHDLVFLPRGDVRRPPDATIRIADAIFACVAYGRYKFSKAQLERIAGALRARGSVHRLLVTAEGRHFPREATSRWLARTLGSLGAAISSEADETIAVFCIDQSYYVGLQHSSYRDAPNRRHRVHERPGALPAPIAAAMSFVGRPQPDETVADLFCGSGTLLAEAASYATPIRIVGFDLDREAIAAARTNLVFVEGALLEARDGRQSGVASGTVDLFVSNLPFGKRFGDRSTNRALYAGALEEMVRLGAPGRWRGVLLTADDPALSAAIRDTRAPLDVRQVAAPVVRGEPARIFLVKPAAGISSTLSSSRETSLDHAS